MGWGHAHEDTQTCVPTDRYSSVGRDHGESKERRSVSPKREKPRVRANDAGAGLAGREGLVFQWSPK